MCVCPDGDRIADLRRSLEYQMRMQRDMDEQMATRQRLRAAQQKERARSPLSTAARTFVRKGR